MADVIAEIDQLREAAQAATRRRGEADRKLAGAEALQESVAADMMTQFGVGTVAEARDLGQRAEKALRSKLAAVRELMEGSQ